MSDKRHTGYIHGAALEILCRVFDDGADAGIREWRDWYKPSEWIWWPRALGSFIWRRLASKVVGADLRELSRAHATLVHLSRGAIGSEEYLKQSQAVDAAMKTLRAAAAAIAEPQETGHPVSLE